MDVFKAILNIRPGSKFAVSGNAYNGLEWYDDNDLPPPTEEEVNIELERLQKTYENTQYKRDRASEYPSIEDQLDILYHGGYEVWKEQISKIKEKYPKP